MDYSELASLPAATPPPGVVPNFGNPPSRALEMYIGMGICLGISTFFLALRMYAKFRITHNPGWDDLACSIGLVFFIPYVALTFATLTPHGPLGTHQWEYTVGQLGKGFEQKTLALLVFFAAAAFFIRFSLFLLYLRLFRPNKYTRWLVYGGIITCGLFYSASIVGNCAIMMPTPGQSNDDLAWLLREYKIEDKLWAISIAQGVFGFLSDIYLLVIPIQMIFQLQFSLERKIGVSSVFMIGILAIVCSLAGAVSRIKAIERKKDDTWNGVSTYIFASAELSAGIVCSCMPIYACFLRGHIPKSLHYLSPRQIYLNLRSLSSRRPLNLNQTHSLDTLPPQKSDSYLGARSDDYAQIGNGSGLGQTKNSVMTQRERLEY